MDSVSKLYRRTDFFFWSLRQCQFWSKENDCQSAYPQGRCLSWVSAQHYFQFRPYAVHWKGWCSSLLKSRAANIPFWKWCKVKSWGLYRNRLQKPENGAGEAMQSQKSASAKRKAPYFLRSTVLFIWRLPGSNRWPLACHASALPNHALTHPHAKARGWTIFGVRTLYFEKDTFSPKSNAVA